MTRKLTLGEPKVTTTIGGAQHIEWYLLGKGGRGYLVSWLEAAIDTGLPECMAFKAVRDPFCNVRVTSWNERAASYNRDAARALEEVVKQLEELYDIAISVGDPASALRPGEVVADG